MLSSSRSITRAGSGRNHPPDVAGVRHLTGHRAGPLRHGPPQGGGGGGAGGDRGGVPLERQGGARHLEHSLGVVVGGVARADGHSVSVNTVSGHVGSSVNTVSGLVGALSPQWRMEAGPALLHAPVQVEIILASTRSKT